MRHGARFRQEITLEEAIGYPTPVRLKRSPLESSFLLPVATVNYVQTLQAAAEKRAAAREKMNKMANMFGATKGSSA
jgi:hypothetical protein